MWRTVEQLGWLWIVFNGGYAVYALFTVGVRFERVMEPPSYLVFFNPLVVLTWVITVFLASPGVMLVMLGRRMRKKR